MAEEPKRDYDVSPRAKQAEEEVLLKLKTKAVKAFNTDRKNEPKA